MTLQLSPELQFDTQITLSTETKTALFELMAKVRHHKQQVIWEGYKQKLAPVAGRQYWRSTNENHAFNDCNDYFSQATSSGVDCIIAVYNAFSCFEEEDISVPSDDKINQVLRDCSVPLKINDGCLEPTCLVTKVEIPSAEASKSETLKQALDDARLLVDKHSSPKSAIDRIHTALVCYLDELCDESQITFNKKDGLTKAFKELSKKHIAFQQKVAHQNQINKIVNSFGNIIDAANPIRNHGSLAHNNQLLEDPEAKLYLNAVSTIFSYIQDSINRYEGSDNCKVS